jgi:hypothetical protein
MTLNISKRGLHLIGLPIFGPEALNPLGALESLHRTGSLGDPVQIPPINLPPVQELPLRGMLEHSKNIAITMLESSR